MTTPATTVQTQTVQTQVLQQRPPVLKIGVVSSQQQRRANTYHVSSEYSYGSQYTTNSTSPTTYTSSQGGHCCGCGGIFVISNKCSNRECHHVQCSKCY